LVNQSGRMDKRLSLAPKKKKVRTNEPRGDKDTKRDYLGIRAAVGRGRETTKTLDQSKLLGIMIAGIKKKCIN